MTTVLYPGSFDPFHHGHRELVETASRLFDGVVVAVVPNLHKAPPLFGHDERREMVAASLAHLPNVEVTSGEGLVVDLAREVGAGFIVKGLRALSDLESEMSQAQMNLAISGVHTVFIPSTSERSYISSRFVREIARLGGDVGAMVPDVVAKRLKERCGA